MPGPLPAGSSLGPQGFTPWHPSAVLGIGRRKSRHQLACGGNAEPSPVLGTPCRGKAGLWRSTASPGLCPWHLAVSHSPGVSTEPGCTVHQGWLGAGRGSGCPAPVCCRPGSQLVSEPCSPLGWVSEMAQGPPWRGGVGTVHRPPGVCRGVWALPCTPSRRQPGCLLQMTTTRRCPL